MEHIYRECLIERRLTRLQEVKLTRPKSSKNVEYVQYRWNIMTEQT